MAARNPRFLRVAELLIIGLVILLLGLIMQGCGGLATGPGSNADGGTGGPGSGSGGRGGATNTNFLYAVSISQPGQPNVWGGQIQPGDVKPVPDSPFLASGFTPTIAAYGDLLFTLAGTSTSNVLLSWRVDHMSGSLKQIASMNLVNGGNLATGGTGKFLYAVLDAQVAVYSIDPGTGNLIQIPGSPFTVTNLNAGIVSPDGKWICGPAFAGPGGSQLECDQLDPSTGAVVSRQGQAVQGTSNFLVLGFTADDLLIAGGAATGSSESFEVLQITTSGFQVLSSVPVQVAAGGAISPDNKLVVGVDARTQQVNVYRFGESKGSLRLISQAVVPDQSLGNAVFTPDGENIAVSFVSGNAVGFYSISSSGSLSPLTGSPISTLSPPATVVAANPH